MSLEAAGRSPDATTVVPSRWRRLSRAVVYGVAVAVVVGALAFLVRTGSGPLVRFDQRVIDAATGFTRAHPTFRAWAEVWEMVSQPWVVYLAVGLPACLYVRFARGLRTRAWWGAATMAAGWGTAALFKLLVRRARPQLDEPFSRHLGYSFPSGHAANNAVVVSVVLILIGVGLGTYARVVAVVVGALWVFVTCADRLFLGAHFPSDVVAGVLLGVGLSLASYAGYLGWRPRLAGAADGVS